MRRLIPILTLITIFLTAPVFAGDRVVARVGDEPVTQRELANALKQYPDLSRQAALDLLIERRLVLVWAAEKNIGVSDQELEQVVDSIRSRNNFTPDQFKEALMADGDTLESFRANLREQLIINKALGVALSSQTKVSEDELRQLYSETYPRKTIFGVSHILIAVDKNANIEEENSARERAKEVLAKIADGVPFADLVHQYSDDSSTVEEDGYLGKFREGELIPELEQLAEKLEPGQVGGPVRTPSGYHILLLVSREVEEPPPFVEVKSQLERQLTVTKEESARAKWLKELKKTTYIEVFPDDG